MASSSVITGGQIHIRKDVDSLRQGRCSDVKCFRSTLHHHRQKLLFRTNCARGGSVRTFTETQHNQPIIRNSALAVGLGSNVLRVSNVHCVALADSSTIPSDPLKAYFGNFGGETDNDTIIAIATPVVPQAGGGIAIIRLSGDEAVSIVQKLFRAKGHKKDGTIMGWKPKSHMANYGTLVDPSGKLLDEVLVLPMLKPRSYTREDVVELHCHGGNICSRRVIAACVELGARPAQPGEFTLRAFLAGRIDLAQAESVEQLIAARTSAAADGALSALRGEGPAAAAKAARAQCIMLLAEVEARLDFEEDLPPLDVPKWKADVGELAMAVEAALLAAERAVVAHTGMAVALVGRPNVGKSSLLNAWSNSARAIVTPIPGTTRDIIEAQVELRGLPVTLLDTAGIRDQATADEVERIGIQRSEAAAGSADVLLMVVDATAGWTAEDTAIFDLVVVPRPSVPAIMVINKTDLAPPNAVLPPPHVAARFDTIVPACANTRTGLEELAGAVTDTVLDGSASAEGSHWAGTQRQVEMLQQAARALRNLEETMAVPELPVDLWTIDLREATYALGAVTGEEVTEDVLGSIFSRFCIGK